jgi:DNA repair exonuclease SbcCD ATPase subunit
MKKRLEPYTFKVNKTKISRLKNKGVKVQELLRHAVDDACRDERCPVCNRKLDAQG